ncbi:MAG: PQQ-binding-like beta-propeller repeat protein [Armatimonadetes bacterium]|nr:PQQ-binding-like beta-propeller repeat protein [Armatimonadota bacterium]
MIIASFASAQDYRQFRGNHHRTGMPTLAPSTPPLTPPSSYNNAGRSFLRWWDPILANRVTLDTGEIGTLEVPPIDWTAVGVGNVPLAFNFLSNNILLPPYVFARTVPSLSFSQPTLASPGFTAAHYEWRFFGVGVGQEYELFVNIPIGPTDVDPSVFVTQLMFPQKFYVFEVLGVVGGPIPIIVDTFTNGGGFLRLNDLLTGITTFTADSSGQIAVRLYNTTPRGPNGDFLDAPFADPGNELVYADAAELVNLVARGGSYAATPIVSELTANPPGGGPAQLQRRVYASRIEETTVGQLNKTFMMGVLSSYAHNGLNVFDPTGLGRRNRVFDWPVRRPFSDLQVELDRYASDKRDWILNAGGKTRSLQVIQQDNLNGGVAPVGGFLVGALLANYIGVNYYIAPVTNGATNSTVTFQPDLPEDNYFVWVWMPDLDDGSALAIEAQYEIMRGGAVVQTIKFNQSIASGWVPLPDQPTDGYSHSTATRLSVRVVNHSDVLGDLGRQVFADAVRFVRTADLQMRSTSVQVRTDVRLPGGAVVSRDVLIIAMENGRIYCIDAHGDPVTADPPRTYWAYPSEDVFPDPNHVAGEDGKDGMAEMPTGFDISSALVANVGGQDFLYIGTKNGRVYCLELTGRGDGTTRRVWTYPDDYNPLFPAAPRSASLLGPIAGSISFGPGGGTPTIYVPTTQGRIFALDAAGTPATKSTTVRWQYPPATVLGPITMAPAVAFGNVYFGAPDSDGSPNGTMFAIDEVTGLVVWFSTGTVSGSHGRYGPSSPAVVDRSLMTGGGPFEKISAVFAMDDKGRFVSFNALTGAFQWETTELGSAATSSLLFTHQTVYNNAGLLALNTPVILVPTVDGHIASFPADGSINRALRHQFWGVTLDGDEQIGSVASGGKAPGEIHSWLYVADSAGLLYAFNFDPVLGNNQIITRGDQPIFRDTDINNPNDRDLDNIMLQASFILLVPDAYDSLLAGLQDGTLKYSDLTSAASTQAALRRSFEFGEALYVLIYDLPELFGANSNYNIEIQLSGGRRASTRRQIQVRFIPDGPTQQFQEKFMLGAFPMLPTGSGGLVPGDNTLRARAILAGSSRQRGAAREIPIKLANPIGIVFLENDGFTVASSVGNTTDVFHPMVQGNGNVSNDQGNAIEPFTAVGPSLSSQFGNVAHGTTGVTRMLVLDRSLMRLIYGRSRGLSGIRFSAADVAWIPDGSADGGVWKPLTDNVGAVYPSFEDYPIFVPNSSLDYPDVNRDRIVVTKQAFGRVDNPQFIGVELVPPAIASIDETNYRTADPNLGYDRQMTRVLARTDFDIDLNVPRYQPPSNRGQPPSNSGYYGSQTVYVDAGRTGRDPGNVEPYRTIGLGLGVAVDERLTVGTPTVDLSSLPAGGGFNGGLGFGPRAPWDPVTQFSPWNSIYRTGAMKMFDPFSVFNEGNVNLLNVRVAKEFDSNSLIFSGRQYRPVELYSDGLHELSWLDASLHLHTNLDPRFSATGPLMTGIDPLGRNILQKARPGDVAPTRLSVNPRSRINPNLPGSGSLLMDPGLVPVGDAAVGVTVPIGVPVGDYIRRIFAFEDRLGSNRFAWLPSLGQDEPFSDPGFTLKFTVRESRFTTKPTLKAAPNMESLLMADIHRFPNAQPSAMRDGRGNLFVVFASSRIDVGPNWDPMVRTEADYAAQNPWRIYLSSLVFDGAVVPPVTQSPIGDYNGWLQSSGARWFNRSLAGPFPTAAPSTLFTLGPGEVVVPSSVQFGAPTFPSSGSFDLTQFPDESGRVSIQNRYMAFLGSAAIAMPDGSESFREQVFLQELGFLSTGLITENAPATALPFDYSAGKSQPSLVQTGNSATVFYTSNAGGLGVVDWAHYNGLDWTRPSSLQMGNAFESVDAPSAVLRRYQNRSIADPSQPIRTRNVIDVVFTAKLRGRSFSEAFMTRLSANANGRPTGRTPQAAFGPRIDELLLDPATGTYWAPGAVWRLGRSDLFIADPTAPFSDTETYIDVLRIVGGTFETVVDKTTRTFDRDTGLISYSTALGGRVYVDTNTGSIRFSGAVVPRSMRLYVRYAPYYLKVSAGPGANYRSASMVYDDRFIGIYFDAIQPIRNRLGDISYWGNQANGRPAFDDLLRWDRHVISFTRTSSDGTQAARPFLKTVRFGVQLPTAIALNADGSLFNFTVTWDAAVPGAERFYQVDPATGRVFFMAGTEDRRIQIKYRGVDDSGVLYPNLITFESSVGLLTELLEEAVPIEQVGAESGLRLALDPISGAFNRRNFRRPNVYWLFWTSTRTGSPDVYFETIAPRFTPRPPAR